MKLDEAFYQLPVNFDAEKLTAEISQFSDSDWRPHPQGFPGNFSLSLISVGGNPSNDSVIGAMSPTPFLQHCPYLQQLLATFKTVFGRTRLMKIGGNAEVSEHVDTNYYWLQRVRVHFPIITFPEVNFICGEHSVNMAAGEVWIFDTWRRHNVINPTQKDRIHLVADTVGSPFLWDLIALAEQPFNPQQQGSDERLNIDYDPAKVVSLETEKVNFPVVMTPWEQKCLISALFEDFAEVEHHPPELVKQLETILARFCRHWQSLWSQYGVESAGWESYRQVLQQLEQAIAPFQEKLPLPNQIDTVEYIRQAIIRAALHPELATPAASSFSVSSPANPQTMETAPSIQKTTEVSQQLTPKVSSSATPSASKSSPTFTKPIFIVSAPRSGSTLLFETLLQSPTVHTIGNESHGVFESIAKLKPANRNYDSNRLTAEDADPTTIKTLKQNFIQQLQDRTGKALDPNLTAIRLLEKTPKNALRIPFLNAIFPDALFIYLHRAPRENISSILDAWKSGKFIMYPDLPGWKGKPWSMLLTPQWQQLIGKPLKEIAAAQWQAANDFILNDLANIASERWCSLNYGEFLANPQSVCQKLCQFAGIDWDTTLPQALPLSRHTLTAPKANKWHKNKAAILDVLPSIEATSRKIEQLTSIAMSNQPESSSSDQPNPTTDNNQNLAEANSPHSPLRSVHTSNFPQILQEIGASLIVSTYQAGKLILVRADGELINTHFRVYQKPMGIASSREKIAVGTGNQIWELHNVPAVCKKLDPPDKHDACYLPRNIHVTGDIDIHEMGWGDDGLWFINTRFCCLCNLDQISSFVPRWRPKFISALSPEDRCHLNGLGMVDGKPKYVTALGNTDTAGGWRENKANGGILLDIQTGQEITRGLSMPHSPRWYRDRLWVLESGNGSLATVDLNTGKLETIVQLPGFTRGFDFWGPLAFIGLSQVRETAVFSGIPLTERLDERTCGVWVVNIETGQSIAFLKFEEAVQEIFAVQVLPGIRFPEILDIGDELINSSYNLPDEALGDVPQGLRQVVPLPVAQQKSANSKKTKKQKKRGFA